MTGSQQVAAPGGGSPSGPSPAVPRVAGAGTVPPRTGRRNRLGWRATVRRDWQLYSLLVLPLLFLLVFRYLPIAGNVIAFRRFRPGGSIFGDEWVGLHYVELFIHDAKFWDVFQNTVVLGGLTLIFVFPLPIVLALMLNELRSRRFKRLAQTISYLPHFMSIVIVAGMIFQIFSLLGLVVYYIVQSVLRILQQVYITKRFYGHDEALGRQAQRAGEQAREIAKQDGGGGGMLSQARRDLADAKSPRSTGKQTSGQQTAKSPTGKQSTGKQSKKNQPDGDAPARPGGTKGTTPPKHRPTPTNRTSSSRPGGNRPKSRKKR